jgi:hypothetical protein
MPIHQEFALVSQAIDNANTPTGDTGENRSRLMLSVCKAGGQNRVIGYAWEENP